MAAVDVWVMALLYRCPEAMREESCLISVRCAAFSLVEDTETREKESSESREGAGMGIPLRQWGGGVRSCVRHLEVGIYEKTLASGTAMASRIQV